MPSLSVSVILPTCHRPDHLRAAVASVCAQTYAPTEILVVDDGGEAEETRSLLPAAATVPIRLLSGSGAGPGAARNLGLQHAQGELVAFLDDDDLWLRDKLRRQVEWMARSPELGVLGTGVLRTQHPTDRLLTGPAPGRLRYVGRASLLRANRLTTSTVVARRRCLEEFGGFEAALPLAQDWDLWLRVSRRWRVAVLPTPLAQYRLHGQQRSTGQSAMRRWEGEVMRRALGAGDLNWWLTGIAQRRLAWAECRLGRALWREHRPQQAAQALWRSLSLYPLHLPAWTAVMRCALQHGHAAEAPRP